jgi:hypothetical protein
MPEAPVRNRRLFWQLVLLAITLVGAVGANLLLDWRMARWSGGATYAPDFSYSAIEPDLYIGGRVEAPPPGTTTVLSLTPNPDPYPAAHYQWSPIQDAAPAPSLAWLRQQVDFVAAQRRAGERVFVHCDAGVSRSGLVVAAYLMELHRWRRDEALAFIRTHRAVVHPNAAFMVLLQEWEESLGLSPPSTRPHEPA